MFAKIKEKLNKWHIGIVIIIFIVAAAFRFIGIGWGMPNGNLHPDEVIIYSPAYQNALGRNFEIKDYYRPNHVSVKLNTLLYVGIQDFYFAPRGLDDFALNYAENFSLFTVASRTLVALLSLGTVIFAYLILLNWGKNQALFGAMLFAVFPSFIENSHYITPDIPVLFFLMGVLWAALCYLKKPTMNWLFWMSLLSAFAVCEKYPGAYGCVIIAVVVITKHIKKPLLILRDGLLSILFFLLGILAISPVLIIDFRTVLEVMAGQNKQYHLGADGLNFGQTLWFYTKTTATHIGLILTLGCIYGMVRALMKKTSTALVMLPLIIYVVPISMLSIHWERYTLPIYAICLLFGSIGVIYAMEDLKTIFTKVHATQFVACFLFVLLPIGSLTAGAMAESGRFLAPDSRILLQSVFANLDVTPDNTTFDSNTPLDPGGFYGAFNNFEAGNPAQYKYGSSPKYVMTSSAQRDLYLEADPEVYGWISNFYRKLDSNYNLVYYQPVEIPSSHFLELQNIWFSARSVYRYMCGSVTGYEIRLYQLVQ